MQHIADASANGIIRRSLLAATIGLVAIFASIVVGQPFGTDTASAASATSGEGPEVSLICKRVTASGLALCRLTSVDKLEVGDQVTFQASTPDGSQQDVTIEYQGRVGFRDAPSCEGQGACYVVWFRMQQAGAPQVAVSGVTYQPVGSTAPESIIEQPETQAVVSTVSPTISPTISPIIGNAQQAGVQTADETGDDTGDQSNGDQSASGQATSAQTIESGGAQAQIGASQQQSKPTKQQSQQAQGTQQQISTQQQGGQVQNLSQPQQSETQSESQQPSTSSSSGSQAETNGIGDGDQGTTVTIKAEETTDGTKVVVTDGEDTRTHDSTNEAENDDPQAENEEWKKDIRTAVDDGKTISINTGVGTGTPSEQFTTIQIEQEAYDAGAPYEVCFDHPERIRPGKTVVSGGKTIVIPTIVTPAETICHMVTPE